MMRAGSHGKRSSFGVFNYVIITIVVLVRLAPIFLRVTVVFVVVVASVDITYNM